MRLARTAPAIHALLGACASLPATAPIAPATPAPRAFCGPVAEIARALARRYGEHVVSQGRQVDGSVLQIYASKNRRTWTVVVTPRPGRFSCLIAAGINWETIPQGDPT